MQVRTCIGLSAMGGGTVFRGMARLVGAATVGAAAVPTTGAFCRTHTPAMGLMREEESLSVLLNNKCQKHCCDVNTNSEFGSSVDVRFELEEDDWAFAEKEESSSGAALRQLVFSPPPTEEEVEEATKELHAALHLSIPAEGFRSEEDRLDANVGLASCEYDVDPMLEASDKRVTSTSSPSSVNHLGALVAESSSVMQAFQLLQTNSKVQDVVKSLACDPAVWNAVLSNEKMQELTQEDPLGFQVAGTDTNDDEIIDSDEETLTSMLYGFVTMRTKVYYSTVKGKLLSILNSMFGSMEKTIFSKGTSAKDKTVASCMMLAVAVLIVVVMRRRH